MVSWAVVHMGAPDGAAVVGVVIADGTVGAIVWDGSTEGGGAGAEVVVETDVGTAGR